jgi:uncharacterized repeat protein (TIGR03803 family)
VERRCLAARPHSWQRWEHVRRRRRGGDRGCGTLFKWAGTALHTLHSFDCGVYGVEAPSGGIVQGSDGNFYGTTIDVYYSYSSGGTIYQWNGSSLVTLHTFDWTTGWSPYAGLLQTTDGALVGVANEGGDYGVGTLFKWHNGTLSVLRSFDWYDGGYYPIGSLVQAADESIFGTAYYGGANGYGTLFKVTGDTFSVVHNFSLSDGGSPYLSLTLLADGSIAGALQTWDPSSTIFKWNGSSLTTLYSFDTSRANGVMPSGLTLGRDHNLYGSTSYGGSREGGTLFRLVFNVPPVITSITGPPAPIAVNMSGLVTVAYTDESSSPTCTFAWGDGQPDTTVVGSTGACSAAHAFTEAGVYTVSVTVTDSGELSDTEVSPYIVIYDPSAGFVTGSGWIQSPAGAYGADTTLAGKAAFGFFSKYQRGTTVPVGDTSFEFNVGAFTFKNSSYEWLVISGPKAQYKGVGMVNGAGDYGFLLTVTDGQITGGGGTDRFRIKIWDRTSGTIVYDNVVGGGDTLTTANPQEINGGSIVIHAK